MGLSQFESSHGLDKPKSMMDLNLDKIPLVTSVVQDHLPIECREIEADRDKKLNQILKKVAKDDRKSSPDGHCLTDRSSLQELAKTQISNLDKSFKSQISKQSNKTSNAGMPMQKTKSTNGLRKKSTGRQSQKSSLHPDLKKAESRKYTGRHSTSKRTEELSNIQVQHQMPQPQHFQVYQIDIEKKEPVEQPKEPQKRQTSQVNKYLELIQKNSAETPLVNVEVETGNKSLLDYSQDMNVSNNTNNTTPINVVQVPSKVTAPNNELKEKKEKKKREDRKKDFQQHRNSFAAARQASSTQNAKTTSTPANEQQSQPTERKKKTSGLKAKGSQKSLVKATSRKRGGDSPGKTDVERKKKNLDKSQCPTPTPIDDKQYTTSQGTVTHNQQMDQSQERHSDLPMNIITKPLMQAEDGQEFNLPIVTNSAASTYEEQEPIKSRSATPQDGVGGGDRRGEFQDLCQSEQQDTSTMLPPFSEKSQSCQAHQEGIMEQMMAHDARNSIGQLSDSRPSLSNQFIVSTQQISMFINRKSIDMMASPQQLAEISERSEVASSQQSAYGKNSNNTNATVGQDKKPSPIVFQSQEIVQDFQKEPLYLLTLSGKRETANPKSTIYLTTNKEINQDPLALMQNIQNFVGKSKPDVFENFVFKILSGTNANSPLRIKKKLQEMGQNIIYLNCGQQITVKPKMFAIENRKIKSEQIGNTQYYEEESEEENEEEEIQMIAEESEQVKKRKEDQEEEVGEIQRDEQEIEPEDELIEAGEQEIEQPEEDQQDEFFKESQPIIEDAELKDSNRVSRISNFRPPSSRQRPSVITDQKSVSSMKKDPIKSKGCRNFNTHITSNQSSLNLNLSNESEEQQEPDTIPTPQMAPPPMMHNTPATCPENLKDFFVQGSSRQSDQLPAQIHQTSSNTQTIIEQKQNHDLSDVETPNILWRQEMKPTEAIDCMMMNQYFDRSNDSKLKKKIELSNEKVHEKNKLMMHKRHATEIALPSFGGPTNVIDVMTDSEQMHKSNGDQIINISDTNCHMYPMDSPQTMPSSTNYKSSNTSKTKRNESKVKATSRNPTNLQKKPSMGILPPRHGLHHPVAKQPAYERDSSHHDHRIGHSTNSSHRPSQVTSSLKSASFIPEIPQKLAKVQDVVNRATSIVRNGTGPGNRSQSTKQRRDSSHAGSKVGPTSDRFSKALKGTANQRQGSSSVSKTRGTAAVGLANQRTGSVTKRGASKQKERSGYGADKKFNNLLLASEQDRFGDRCPTGFKKVGLLGKGGAAIVWLAEVTTSNRKYNGTNMSMVALKQFPKAKGKILDQSAKTEIEIGNILFPFKLKDGYDGNRSTDFKRVPALSKQEYPGMGHITQFIDQIEDSRDVWLVYEVGPQCFRKVLSDVKGEFYKGERIYKVQHLQFYNRLLANKQALRSFIVKVAQSLDVLQHFGIVHSDLKPDNILVEMNQNNSDVTNIKIIDFGTSFQFYKATQVAATTPEYLAPEILKTLDDRNNPQKVSQQLTTRCKPWSFDVWSLGIILLEIATGCPVWMSLKCRVQTVEGKNILCHGLFGVQQREVKKIISKQHQVLKNIYSTLKKFECYGLDEDPYFMDLLARTLCEDPLQRISPREIIRHQFCCQQQR